MRSVFVKKKKIKQKVMKKVTFRKTLFFKLFTKSEPSLETKKANVFIELLTPLEPKTTFRKSPSTNNKMKIKR
jgi:hypothetical protein